MQIAGAKLSLQVEPSHVPLHTPLRLATVTVAIARYGDSVEQIVAFYRAFSLPTAPGLGVAQRGEHAA